MCMCVCVRLRAHVCIGEFSFRYHTSGSRRKKPLHMLEPFVGGQFFLKKAFLIGRESGGKSGAGRGAGGGVETAAGVILVSIYVYKALRAGLAAPGKSGPSRCVSLSWGQSKPQ